MGRVYVVIIFLSTLLGVSVQMGPLRAEAVDSEFATLSETDPRYAVLEEIQRRWCEREVATHPCQITYAYCSQLMLDLAASNFGDVQLTGELEALCRTRATKYELPGINRLLSSYYERVARVARDLDMAPETEPIFGALPLPQISARVNTGKDGPEIIIIHVQLLSFINEYAKVAAQSIPFAIREGTIAMDATEIGSLSRIEGDPGLRDHFIGLTHRMLGLPYSSYLPPDEISRTVQVAYTEGVEIFVFAHEYGHVVFSHGAQALDSLIKASGDVAVSDHVRGNSSSALDELVADMFALKVLLALQGENKRNPSKNVMTHSVIYGVEFFWTAKEILREADEIRQSDEDGATSKISTGPADVWSDAALNELAACVIAIECDIVATVADIDGLAFFNNHPPHEFRSDLISSVVAQMPQESRGEFDMVAQLVNRNLKLLWDVTRDDFVASLASD